MLVEHFHMQKASPHMALAISRSTPQLLAAAANHYDNQTAPHFHVSQECEDGGATPMEKTKD